MIAKPPQRNADGAARRSRFDQGAPGGEDGAPEGAPGPGIKKGSRCWYTDRDGSRREVEVLSVDDSIRPASYAIQIDANTTRETEVPPHQPSTPFPPKPLESWQICGVREWSTCEGGPSCRARRACTRLTPSRVWDDRGVAWS